MPKKKPIVDWVKLTDRNGDTRLIPVIRNQKKTKLWFKFPVREHRK